MSTDDNARSPAGNGRSAGRRDQHERNPTLYGFDLPAPDMSEAALIAWTCGYLAGYDRGQADGYACGFATADKVLRGAVAAALGRPGDDFTTAVRRNNRALAVVDYRRQFDARDREVA